MNEEAFLSEKGGTVLESRALFPSGKGLFYILRWWFSWNLILVVFLVSATFILLLKMIIIGGKIYGRNKNLFMEAIIDGQFTYLRDVLRVR
ncbi:hypothetical protein ACLZX5_03105 [Enterococcus faecium]|nr:hypothetical protein [Enterococcus faecium]